MAAMASCAIPVLNAPVEIDGRFYYDGGVGDSIPAGRAVAKGYGKVVAVLTRHKGYRKEPESVRMAEVFYRKYPAFVKALQNRHLAYNRTLHQIEELEAAGEIFVIRPSQPLEISRTEHDPARLQQVYDIGRRDALCRMRDLERWLRDGKEARR